LVEFGLVASLSVLSTYAICLILITILYSYLPIPKEKHLSRLEGKRLRAFLRKVDYLVNHRRRLIYGTVTVLVIISIYGLSQIKAVGYIVDDLPKNDPILTDLKFFKKHFHGVMPFEVNVDSGRPGRASRVSCG
jgi:predicted RND superfamily exporter protein